MRGKFWRLWTPWYVGSQNRSPALVACVYYGTILIAFGLAVPPVTVWMFRRQDPALIIPCMIVATVAMALVFHGQHRYRFPIDSLCTVIAAGGLTWLVGHLAWRSFRATLAALWTPRHTLGLAVIVLLAVAFGVVWKIDEDHIHTYRVEIARQRLEAIEDALAAYEKKCGRPPERLEDLVPEFLPTVETLHCPTHSLEYRDYQLLGSRDARAAAQVVSYEIERVPGAHPEGRLVQVRGTPLIVPVKREH